MDIRPAGSDRIIITDDNGGYIGTGCAVLTLENQREVIAWFKAHRMNLIRDVVCEECDEVC